MARTQLRAGQGFVLLGLLLVASACAPELRDGLYRCSPTGGCPGGWTCRLGHASATEMRCYRPADGGGSALDGGLARDAAADAPDDDAFVPSPCDDGSAVVELVAGAEHTCARRASGSICCWGENADGQLGTGGLEPSPVPLVVAVPAGVTLEGLDAGERTTCAVDRTTRRAYCWGAVPAGAASRAEPVPAPLDAEGVLEVSAGGGHVCVRAGAEGTVRCAGRGDSGELGDDRFAHSVSFVEPTGLVASHDVDTAEQISCAVRSSRNVSCWGLDPGSATALVGLPQTVERPGEIPLSRIERVVVAAGHRCAWGSGAVYCWGNDHAGQLDGRPEAAAFYAVEVPRAAGARHVAVGSGADPLRGHSCAALETGVVCWGDNAEGQLGSGDTRPVTQPVLAELPPGGAQLVAAGSGHSCALLDDARVFCWGANHAGQLGMGATVPSPTPVPVLGHGG